jgi:5-methylcytosine-specific restriction endonuclease McrA
MNVLVVDIPLIKKDICAFILIIYTNHVQKLNNDIELTQEIKDYILANRRYRIPTSEPSSSTASSSSQQEQVQPQTTPRLKSKKKGVPTTVRIACWNTYIGEDVGKHVCMCCQNLFITQHNFHCGHVVAEAKGGSTDVSNLRPICEKCNYSMGTENMADFAKTHFNITI